MKFKDFPPMWLAGFAGLAWLQSTTMAMGLSFGQLFRADIFGLVLIGAGVVLMALAIFELGKNKTTFIPRLESTRLVTSGIYHFTRNPDYLGDVLVLAGLVFYWDAALSLLLIPLFAWVLKTRFITGEERHLRAAWAGQFTAYEKEVRRWI